MNINHRALTVIGAIGILLLASGTNAMAASVTLSDEGIRSWEVVETAVERYEGTVEVNEETGELTLVQVFAGWTIKYDIFNNTTYEIKGFLVGITDALGAGSLGSTSSIGWNGTVASRWDYNNGEVWDSDPRYGLSDYNYAYEAHYIGECFDCGGELSGPGSLGEPIQPFQGITGEFGFSSDSNELSSPVTLFATDENGQDVVLFGESSYLRGTGQNPISSSSVPVPGAIWLLGSGLVGLIGFSKRKNAKAAA